MRIERITIADSSEYGGFLENAKAIAPHSGDAPYFALAMARNCPIWSNEKSFKRQKRIKVHSTSELALLMK